MKTEHLSVWDKFPERIDDVTPKFLRWYKEGQSAVEQCYNVAGLQGVADCSFYHGYMLGLEMAKKTAKIAYDKILNED